MDPFYIAVTYFRARKFEKCVDACTEILTENPLDQAAWTLKTRALTAQVYVDDIEADEQGIADLTMDDNAVAQVTRPGTSLKTPAQTSAGMPGTSHAYRPRTNAGRPVSGVVRPGTLSAVGEGSKGLETALRTGRTAKTARPCSAASGRHIRLGTASMSTQADGPFINIARLNLSKYAGNPGLAKPLFEYILYQENDVKTALDLAALATEASAFKDWWWKYQLGKCYYRLGLFRDAEKQFRSSLRQQPMIPTYLHLGLVCVRLDQPLAALEVYNEGLNKFPKEVRLLTGIARIHEGLNDLGKAVKVYKDLLISEATNVEAIACVGLHHFYNDQPELGLRFYRRLLQMGLYNGEIYNNIALCCFYAQQFDMTLKCFERALALVSGIETADVWFNIGCVALSIGDTFLAYQCFRLALVHNSDHAESFNNIGVLEMRKGHPDTARAFFRTAASLAPHLYEPHFNFASLADKMGDLQGSYIVVQKALKAYPEHVESLELLQQLRKYFVKM